MTRAEAWVRFAAGAAVFENDPAEAADALLAEFDCRFVRVDNEWVQREDFSPK